MQGKHNHNGHRQRIKNRVKKYGLKSLENHEIMEVLLTYCIPRKDTNELAHTLLSKFSTISNIIDAEKSQLKLVNGVGEETVLFFNILKDFVDLYLENKKEDKLVKIDTTLKCVEYFNKHFQVKKYECFYVFCLTKTGVLSHHYSIEGESELEVEFPIKSFIDNISLSKVKQVVVIHTHPYGPYTPSKQDIITTDRMNSICTVMGVDLVDHIILNNEQYFSFKRNGLIGKISIEQANKDLKSLKDILTLNKKY